MVNTNEIMLGNQFVVGKGYDWEEYVSVEEIFSSSVSLHSREFTTYSQTLEPIHITEEILQKNGFIKRSIVWLVSYEKEIGGFVVSFHNSSNTKGRDWYMHIDTKDRLSCGGVDVQYIHQAQNLANIVGFELTFEL